MPVSRRLESVDWANMRREAREADGEADSEDEKNALAVRMSDVLVAFLSRFDPNFDPCHSPYLRDVHSFFSSWPEVRTRRPVTDLAIYLHRGSEKRSKGLGKGNEDLGKGSKGSKDKDLGKGSNKGLQQQGSDGSKGSGKGGKDSGKDDNKDGKALQWVLARAATTGPPNYYGLDSHWTAGGLGYRNY